MARADSMISLQKVRTGLQHAYAEVAPGELYKAVAMLRRDVRGFLDDYQRWIKTAVAEPR